MSMSESGRSWEYGSLSKKPRIESEGGVRQHILTHLEETEEAALKEIIWCTCHRSLQRCKQLSDQLYHSLLDGAATLAYLLYDKEELYHIGCSRMLYDQQNKFWDELKQFANKQDSIYEVCKWIARTIKDWNAYSLLNECDVAHMLRICKDIQYTKPYTDYLDCDLQIVESPFDGDILAAIKKVKQLVPRLTVDEYTLLLIEIYRDYSEKYQEYLVAKAIQRIDVEALYKLDADAVQNLVGLDTQSSAHEELDSFIYWELLQLVMRKRRLVTIRLTRSCQPFYLFLKNEFDKNEIDQLRQMSIRLPSVLELIEVAEIRRKAENCRFINRNHFLWALNERGCGLHTSSEEQLASRMAAEDHPPYHIYFIVLRLAKVEFVPPNVDHLAYAVICGKFGFFFEVEELRGDFKRFLDGVYNVCKPKDWIRVPDDSFIWDDNMKEFKKRLMERGVGWNPFRG